VASSEAVGGVRESKGMVGRSCGEVSDEEEEEREGGESGGRDALERGLSFAGKTATTLLRSTAFVSSYSSATANLPRPFSSTSSFPPQASSAQSFSM
jgi:hypothetical protein